MILSAFDTGKSTGAIIVRFTNSGKILYVRRTTVQENELEEIADQFIRESDYVLIERIPVSSKPNLHLIQNIVFKSCDKFNKEFLLIFPGTWKPFVKKAMNWKKTLQSQHEQDAYDLLRYHVFVNKGINLGDLDE